jgi:hypothetical protein
MILPDVVNVQPLGGPALLTPLPPLIERVGPDEKPVPRALEEISGHRPERRYGFGVLSQFEEHHQMRILSNERLLHGFKHASQARGWMQ